MINGGQIENAKPAVIFSCETGSVVAGNVFRQQSLRFRNHVQQRTIVEEGLFPLEGPDDLAVAVNDKSAMVDNVITFLRASVQYSPLL